MIDTLVVAGLAALNIGTIHEADGVQQRTFWLRNAGDNPVTLVQGYTSCGCTTLQFPQGTTLLPADSTAVSLTFNPRGKGGDFEETGTIAYQTTQGRKHLHLALTGNCITSEETLNRQFPISINHNLRINVQRFDLGRMRPGETKERTLGILHLEDGQHTIENAKVTYTVPAHAAKGLQHIPFAVQTQCRGEQVTLTITLDAIIL